MPRSIDTHKPDCPCPACRGLRGERGERAPQLGIRLDPEVYEWLHQLPEGPRRWIEAAVAHARGNEPPDRQWWYEHIHKMVIGAWKNSQDCHGDALPSSVAKRVASQLADEICRRT